MANKKVLIAFFALTTLIHCQTEKSMLIEWLPTECAPKSFPAEIVEGNLFFPDGNSIYIPGGKSVHNGWAEVGSMHLVGDELKPVPDSLELVWLSLAEMKFYGLSTGLPMDRISNIFNEGFIDPMTNEKSTYDKIVVGMAPDGSVVLWLAGAGFYKEVELFNASPLELDWNKFVEDDGTTREEYHKMAYTDAYGAHEDLWPIANRIPKGKWQTYRETVDWSLRLVGGVQFKGIWVYYFNGERWYADATLPDLNEQLFARMPMRLDIQWNDGSGTTYFGDVQFDEEELYTTMKYFQTLAGSAPPEIIVEVHPVDFTLKVHVNNKDEVYWLKKVDIQVSRL